MHRWRAAGRTLVRVLAVWAVVTATVAVLAGILPDFRLQSPDGDSPTQIAVTAASAAGLFGLLSTLVWPLVVRAILLVPALVLGLLVFFLNGLLLLLALRLIPDGRGTISAQTAVVIAAVLSAASSSTSAWLSVYDDEAYRRRLARLAGRGRGRGRRRFALPEAGDGDVTPGTVFIQLDGVGHDVLETALEGRCLPTLHSWLSEGTHRLTPWRTDWSSQTGASQLAILHGSNHDVPAFRWYDKARSRIVACNNPAHAAELERSRSGAPGLLRHDGASRGNLFSGGAEQNALVLSVSGRPGRRSRSGYFAYFSDPANTTRTFLSFLAEVSRETGQGLRQRLRDERPRVGRGGVYPFVRAFATVVERDVVVAAVIGDMLVGRTAVYADLVGYDEVAHHSGVRAPETLRVLGRLDRAVGLIAGASRYAPRPYRFVLLSDHGQSQGETFSRRYGTSLEELVRTGCGPESGRRNGGRGRLLRKGPGNGSGSGKGRGSGKGSGRGSGSGSGRGDGNGRGNGNGSGAGRGAAPGGEAGAGAVARTADRLGRIFGGAGRRRRRAARRPEHGPAPAAEARAAALAAFGRSGRPEEPPEADPRGRVPAGTPVVLASGNLGLVSFPDVPHRMTFEEIQERHPALLATLAGHPGVGFVLVRGEERGPLVVGAGGVRELGDGADPAPEDEDHPLAPFGPGAAAAVLRTDGFRHTADLMVNSSHDPHTGEVHAFEEQVGSHGGLGGAQSYAFLLHPMELAVPAGPLVGAESVHRVLRCWLDEARGRAQTQEEAGENGREERMSVNMVLPVEAAGPGAGMSP